MLTNDQNIFIRNIKDAHPHISLTQQQKQLIKCPNMAITIQNNFITIMINQQDDDSFSECSSEEEITLQLHRPKIDRLLKEKVNLKKIIINVALTQYPVVSEVARDLGWVIQNDKEAGDWDICWTDFSIEPSILIRMHFHQKINHFPGIHLIARKNLLGMNLMNMKSIMPQQYGFFPSTWLLPSQYSQFRAYYESVDPGKTRTYIVKPEAQCQGRGIFLTRNIKDLQNGKHYVIQRYISKPYLIDGLKFDFRIYVLLAGSPLRAYIYQEGLARFATVPYEQPNSSNMDNLCIHLTNYAINKLNPNFIFNTNIREMDVGHKRSLSSVYRLLQKKGENVKDLKSKINDMIVKTILTGMPSIDHQYRHCQPEQYSGNMCFHVLGFDVMINDKFQPYLIEVNHTPSFTTDTPLDQNIKYRLIRDSLKIMNINTKVKTQLFNKAQQYNQQRLLTGKRQIYHQGEKPKQFIECQEQRDLYQDKHLGGFQRIHPLKDNSIQGKYDKIYDACRKIYFQRDPSTLNMQDRQGKKLFKDQYKGSKKSEVDRKHKNPIDSPQLSKNSIYRTNPSVEKKTIQTISLPKTTKNSLQKKDPQRKQSITKIGGKSLLVNYTPKQSEAVNCPQIKLIQSEIIFPQSKKNSRLTSIKQKKSLKLENEQQIKVRIIQRAGSYLVPKIFSINLELQRKNSPQ